MRGTGFGNGFIDRDGLLPGLQIFLQARFGVFKDAAGIGFFQMRAIDGADKSAAGVETGIQIDSADDRFQGIGEDGCAPPAAASEFAAAQYQLVAQPDFPADLGQLFPPSPGTT